MSGLTKIAEKKLSLKLVERVTSTLPTAEATPSLVLSAPPSGMVRYIQNIDVHVIDANSHTISIMGGTNIAADPDVLVGTSVSLGQYESFSAVNLLLTSGQALWVSFTTVTNGTPMQCTVSYIDYPSTVYGGGYQTVAVETSTTLVPAPSVGQRLLLGGNTRDPALGDVVRLVNYDGGSYVVTLSVGGIPTRTIGLDPGVGFVTIGGGLSVGQSLTMTTDVAPTTPIGVWVAWKDV